MVLAERICKKTHRVFPEIFKFQFVLSKGRKSNFEGWEKKHFEDWTLHHCPSLPVYSIIDSQGNLCGFFLGIGIDAYGNAINKTCHLPFASDSDSFNNNFEGFIDSIAGRYCIIRLGHSGQRVYLDPIGDMGVVYNAETQTVASTLLLALDREIIENEHFKSNDVFSGRKHLSLQHTMDRDVKRALPNHYLDLDTFTSTRHWPKESTSFTPPQNLDKTIAELTTRLSVIFKGLVENYPCLVPISGGLDSRVLVSCGRPYLSSVKQFFVHKFHWASGIDCEVAELVATQIGVPLNIIDAQNPDVQALISTPVKIRQARWRRLTSNGYQDDSFRKHPAQGAVTAVLPQGLVLRGNAMELLRATVWKRSKREDEPFDPEFGLKSLVISDSMEPSEKKGLLAEYMKWVNTVPKSVRNRVYDLAYIEHRLPNFTATYYGYTNNFYIDPFSDRRLLDLILRVPPKVRKTVEVCYKMLDLSSPDLRKIPTYEQVKSWKVKQYRESQMQKPQDNTQ